jgi:hypothetical protein
LSFTSSPFQSEKILQKAAKKTKIEICAALKPPSLSLFSSVNSYWDLKGAVYALVQVGNEGNGD